MWLPWQQEKVYLSSFASKKSPIKLMKNHKSFHFSALSLHPNYVQTRHDFVYIFLTTANQNRLNFLTFCIVVISESREASWQQQQQVQVQL